MNRWLRIRPLLAEAWPHVFGLLVVVAGAVAAGYVLPRSSLTLPIRFAGFVLQILGIAAVAVGITERQRHFQQPGWFSRLWAALKPPKNITVSVALGGVSAVGTASAMAVGAVKPVTVEERLAALESAHEELKAAVRSQFDEVRASVKNAEHKTDTERTERLASIARLRAELRSLTAGGVHIEKAGLAWLVFGTFFSAFPDEVAHWLAAIGR